MKRVAVYLFVLAVLAAGGFSCPVLADSTATYSITGTYGTGTQTTALTAAGQSFAMSFSLPTNPAPLIVSNVLGDDFYLYPLNVNYTFEGTAIRSGAGGNRTAGEIPRLELAWQNWRRKAACREFLCSFLHRFHGPAPRAFSQPPQENLFHPPVNFSPGVFI